MHSFVVNSLEVIRSRVAFLFLCVSNRRVFISVCVCVSISTLFLFRFVVILMTFSFVFVLSAISCLSTLISWWRHNKYEPKCVSSFIFYFFLFKFRINFSVFSRHTNAPEMSALLFRCSCFCLVVLVIDFVLFLSQRFSWRQWAKS